MIILPPSELHGEGLGSEIGRRQMVGGKEMFFGVVGDSEMPGDPSIRRSLVRLLYRLARVTT